MKNYGYFILFLTNIILTFVISGNSQFYPSLFQFYSLYIITTVIFLLDWFFTKPRFSPELLLEPSQEFQENFKLMTQFGDRIMALAIIAVCNIVIYGLAVPDAVVQAAETELLLIIIPILLIPAVLLKTSIEPLAKKSEGYAYQRIKDGILANKVVIPAGLLPLIRSSGRREENIDFTNTDPGLSLQAYPSNQPVESKTIELDPKIKDQIPSENPREVLQEAHKTFILSLFPELSDYIDRKPVSIQSMFFYELLNKVISNEPECRTVLGM
jgi:hypothetical protein